MRSPITTTSRSVAGGGAPAFGADFCGWLGGDDDDGPLLPDDPTEEELATAPPEPPRETFYADVLGRLGERSGPRSARGQNALRLLEGVLR